MKVRARWLIPFAAIPVVGLLAYGFRTDPRAVPSPLVGQPAPAFALTTFDGKAVSLAGQRGKVVVLNFWASWCVPCREEHDALAAAWGRYRDRGVVVLGVSFEDTREAALEVRDELKGDWPLADDYGTRSLPETFVIDARGRIVDLYRGQISQERLDRALDRALG